MLAVAAARGHDALVLGAWGCGVFKNDPRDVAAAFHELLIPPGAPFHGCFRRVTFAVIGPVANRAAFEAAFGDGPAVADDPPPPPALTHRELSDEGRALFRAATR